MKSPPGLVQPLIPALKTGLVTRLPGSGPQDDVADAELLDADTVLETPALEVVEDTVATQAPLVCGGAFPLVPPRKRYEPGWGKRPCRAIILVQTPLKYWTEVQEVPSTFATHEAKQSSTVALESEPIILGVSAAVSQDSLKPLYKSWFVSPCAHASAMERSFKQADAEADEDVETEEEESDEVKDAETEVIDAEAEVTDDTVEDGDAENDVDDEQGELTRGGSPTLLPPSRIMEPG
jgi:hypothetical protein